MRRHSIGVFDSGYSIRQIQIHPHRRERPNFADIGQDGLDASAGDVHEELRSSIQCCDRQGRIDCSFEAFAGFAAELVTASCPEDRQRIEVRRFEDHIDSAGSDLGRCTAHDAGERDGTRIIGDDDVLGVEGALHAVESFELLPRLRTAHDNGAGESVRVERMQGLPQFVQHVVGDVDSGGDRPDAGEKQSALHPPRRHGCWIDAADLAQRESADTRIRLDRCRPRLPLGVRGRAERRVRVFEVEAARKFTRQTTNGECITSVRGDVQLDDGIIEP